MRDIKTLAYHRSADWGKGKAYNMHMSDEGLTIEHLKKYGLSRIVEFHALEGPDVIQDIAIGGNHKLYVLDRQSAVWAYDYENRFMDQLFPPGHDMFSPDARIACLDELLLVADGIEQHGIACFLHSSGQMVWQHLLYEGSIPLIPIAMQTSPSQNVYVMIPVWEPNNEMLDDEDFVFQAGTRFVILGYTRHGILLHKRSLKDFELDRSMTAAELADRFALAVRSDERIYVVDKTNNACRLFTQIGSVEQEFSIVQRVHIGSIICDTTDHLYVGDDRVLGVHDEDDRFILHVLPDGTFDEPISGFRGRSDKLMFDDRNQLFIWNQEVNELSIMQLVNRTKRMSEFGATEGYYFTQAFDSGETNTVWHKLRISAEFAEDTQLRIRYFASDKKMHMIGNEWRELDSFVTNPDIPLKEKLDQLEPLLSKPIVNPRDALFFDAKGKYLWLLLHFVGGETSTFQLNRIDIQFPRVSFLDYLPGVYQSDEESKDFLERFLSLFGTFYLDMEREIEGISAAFDAQSVSGPFLQWLAQWLGIAWSDKWDEERLRLLVREAPDIYKKRGTREAIGRMIEIYTGNPPYIVEYFQYKHLMENDEVRKLLSDLYGSHPYCFCVAVKAKVINDPKSRWMVQRILEEEKPAFCEARLIALQPWMYMGTHSYLEINTVLSEPRRLILGKQSVLPFDTVLTEDGMDHRLGSHTRIDIDSSLE